MKKTLVAIVFLPVLSLLVGPFSADAGGGITMMPNATLMDGSQLEGNSNLEQPVLYCILVLDAPAPSPVTFGWLYTDGTATFGNDYGTINSGTGFIGIGQDSYCFTVFIFGGSGQFDSEPDETLTATVNNLSGALGPFPDNVAVLTIDNDDNMVDITNNQVSADEPDLSSTTVVTSTFNITPASFVSTVITYAPVDGTATAADQDYPPGPQQIVIPALTSTANITMTVNGDNAVEDNETFFYVIQDIQNAILEPTDSVTLTVDIIENDNNCGTTLDGLGPIHPTMGCSSNVPHPGAYDATGPTDANPPVGAAVFFGFDIARDLEYARGGNYVLDGFGGLHADGGAPGLAPAPPYFGFDIAKDLEFLCDGSGAMVLDGFGGVHAVGGAAGVNPAPPYFGFDIARDMELTCPGIGVHVLDGFGGMHAGNGAPAINPAPPYFGFDIARDFELPCGAAGAYVLDGFGGMHAAGGASALNPTTPYFGFDAAVDMELMCPATGFVVLDGFGGFHYGGAAVPVNPTPPYFGFHIARDFEGIQ